MSAKLREVIEQRAVGASAARSAYWFGGDFHDASEDFCRPCACALVDARYAANPAGFAALYGEHQTAADRQDAAIDGGWGGQHDSLPRCVTCGCKLEGTLTDYGVDTEIAHWLDHGAPTDPEEWDDLWRAVDGLADDDPRWSDIRAMIGVAHA